YWACRAIERKQYEKSRPFRVVAVSAMVRGHLERYRRVPRNRITVIPNAIDADRLLVAAPAAVRRDFRARRGLSNHDLAALFERHSFWLKGLEPLLLALHYRRHRDATGRPIHLLVCGRGRSGPFRRLASRLGLAGTVHLAGFLPDVREGYWASDFFVLP